MNYQNVFNESSSYNVDDVVYVDPNQKYTTPVIPNTTWVCVRPVPSAGKSSDYFLSSVVPSYTHVGFTPSNGYANTFRWNQCNNYYPFIPSSGSNQTASIISGYTIIASQSCWQPLGGISKTIITTYSETSSYSIGDEVVVDCNVSYSVPFTVSASSAFPPLCVGFFQCVYPISSGSIPLGTRPAGNVYYPIYPTIPSGSQVISESVILNNTFWKPIVPAQPMCVNGVQMFVHVQISGAMFNMAQLPHP